MSIEIKEISITAVDFNQMKPEDVFKWLERLSFKRRVLNHWIDTKKSEKFVEWMEDSTLEPRLYTSVIIPDYHHRKVIIIIEEEYYNKIKELFEQKMSKEE